MTALAPDHLADMMTGSGLSEETIALAQYASAPPKDFKHLRGVTSAYVIPYFNLDGSVNCYSRMKLFPPITTPDGHTQKYYQAPGSSPHLYVPPLLNWQHVAQHTTTELVITEGEKKAAAGCQHGLIVAGIGGNWCHTSTLDNGDTLTLPMLEEFLWPNRVVPITPDSDAWWETKKARDILFGFFVLARELQQRGALVQFVRLPDLHGAKAGLDDWLLVPGNDAEHSWPKLERLALDDERFNDLNARWQKRKERQATHHALKQHDADELEVTEAAGLYAVRSLKHGVHITFDRLADARGGVSAELSVVLRATELLSGVDLGLKSDTGQTKLASSLKTLAPAIPWKLLLQRACSLVLKRHREGEPVIVLAPSDSIHVPFVVNPVIYKDHQALVYAPGGSLKSYLALFIALQASHGARCAGLSALRVPVLYLDWELNAATVGSRLKALQTGHPDLAEFVPYYRRCDAPLHQEVHQITKQVAERGVQLLIVDSVALASGGDLSSPDAAIKLQRSLRLIGCASLVLAHTSKSIQEGQEKTAYGTVFFRELARNVWELQRADGDNPVRVALHQKKNNFGPTHPALGFEFTFSPDAVRITACNPADEPQFEDRLPVPARIRNLLEDGTLRTARDIAEELDLKLVTVKSALSRGKGHKWQQTGEDYRNPQWTVLRSK